MKKLFDIKDIYGNHYMAVSVKDFCMMENNPYYKDDFFGYINSEEKFVSCKAHKNKNPQAVFVVSAKN